MQRLLIVLFAVSLAWLLVGCGNKGDLYLPEPASAPAADDARAGPTDPTPDDGNS